MKKTVLNILYGMADNLVDIALFIGNKANATVVLILGYLASLFKKYLFEDVGLLPWLVVMVMVDTWAGYQAAKFQHRKDPLHYQKPTYQALREKMAGKMTSYTIALIALNALTNFEVNGVRAQDMLDNMQVLGLDLNLNVLRTIYFSGVVGFMYYEAISIRRNLKIVGFQFLNFKVADELKKVIGEKDKSDGNPS